MRFDELFNTLRSQKSLWDECERDWNPQDPMLNPKVFISIGPHCIPITVEVESVGSVGGASEGIILNTKLNLPQELSQQWFDLQQKVMEYLRCSQT